MTLDDYTCLVYGLTNLCGSTKRCISCAGVVSEFWLKERMSEDEFDCVMNSSVIKNALSSKEHRTIHHMPLRIFLEELRRILEPFIVTREPV